MLLRRAQILGAFEIDFVDIRKSYFDVLRELLLTSKTPLPAVVREKDGYDVSISDNSPDRQRTQSKSLAHGKTLLCCFNIPRFHQILRRFLIADGDWSTKGGLFVGIFGSTMKIDSKNPK